MHCDLHLILLVNLPDNLINHELLFQELLVRLLSLSLSLHELLLQLSLKLHLLLEAFLLQLLLLNGRSLMFASHRASKVCLLTLTSEKTHTQPVYSLLIATSNYSLIKLHSSVIEGISIFFLPTLV